METSVWNNNLEGHIHRNIWPAFTQCMNGVFIYEKKDR